MAQPPVTALGSLLLIAATTAAVRADDPLPGAQQTNFFLPNQGAKAGEFRAAWIHSAYGIEGWGWDKTVAALSSNGFNALLPNLVWAGLAHYPSKVLPVSPQVARQGDQVAECLKACRKYGLQIHVWKVNHNLLHAPPDFTARLRADGRLQKDKKGDEVTWLCPSHPDNFALERDSMLELVQNYDLDGIHFDYIRYPSGESCFCNGCRDRFQEAASVKMDHWPSDVLTGVFTNQFAEWRREQITRLVREVSLNAHRIKPGIKVSAAVFGNWESSRRSVGQDWRAWVEAGYLDFVCPMDYESDYGTFVKLVRNQVGWVNHKIPLYIGLGAHKVSGPEQLVAQVQLSRELGAEGFVIFNLTEKVATEFLPCLRTESSSEKP